MPLQVRKDWGLKGSVGNPGWQNIMRQYLKHDREEALAALGTVAASSVRKGGEASADEGDIADGDPLLKVIGAANGRLARLDH